MGIPLLILETTKIDGTSVVHFFSRNTIKIISILDIIPRLMQIMKEMLLVEFKTKSIKKVSKEMVQSLANNEWVAIGFLNLK